ncbi:MAG: pimeloyl-ACP methyl ester carboxylesterase, partial [Cellvibrionaceae bacterium]
MLMDMLTILRKGTNRQRSTKHHISGTRDNYYLGLSSEGFHRLYYREWGDPSNTDIIVCVHGVTRISYDFDILAKQLSKKYRVICPDIVGRGSSDWLGNKDNYNFIQYCSDLNALFAHIHADRIHLVGTSMGGLLGMILAAMAHTPIESLVLNDVGPDIKRAELQRIGDYIGRAPVFDSEEAYFQYYEETYQ